MPDLRISQLPLSQTSGGALANTDLFALVQTVAGSTLQTRKLTFAQLVTAMSIGLAYTELTDRVTALEGAGGGGGVTDPTLLALAGLNTSANQMIYSTGPDLFSLTSLTAFGRTLAGLADLPALKTLLALVVADIGGAAPLASPALTGTPTVPTASQGTSTNQAASTAFVVTEVVTRIAALVASSPAALDTLNELAAALNNDADFATNVTNALAAKAPLASPALTGTPTAPTAAAGTNTTQIATMAAVQAAKTDAIPQFEVGAGQTLTLTRATHQGATIILAGAGAGIALNATTQGNGFACVLNNQTGSDYTIPTITGATRKYDRDQVHTKLLQAGECSLEVVTWGGTMYAKLIGATG